MTPFTPARRRAIADGGQRLQSYQSYLETDYLNRVKPGGNQGGWIDGGGDARYAEQFWDTLFAKVPELLLFDSRQIMDRLGQRGGALGNEDTNSVLANLLAPIPQPDGSSYTPNMVARTAGYSAELLDRFLGKLGKPVGVPTYKPCNSFGEMYLPDYLGMVGVPIDLVPDFPTNASDHPADGGLQVRPQPGCQDEGVCAEGRHGPSPRPA